MKLTILENQFKRKNQQSLSWLFHLNFISRHLLKNSQISFKSLFFILFSRLVIGWKIKYLISILFSFYFPDFCQKSATRNPGRHCRPETLFRDLRNPEKSSESQTGQSGRKRRSGWGRRRRRGSRQPISTAGKSPESSRRRSEIGHRKRNQEKQSNKKGQIDCQTRTRFDSVFTKIKTCLPFHISGTLIVVFAFKAISRNLGPIS